MKDSGPECSGVTYDAPAHPKDWLGGTSPELSGVTKRLVTISKDIGAKVPIVHPLLGAELHSSPGTCQYSHEVAKLTGDLPQVAVGSEI